LDERYETVIITQNVDDLHERAGSKNIIHLHGELLKSRSSKDDSLTYPCTTDINEGDLCPLGSQLRPHIVWFGEAVPLIEQAIQEVASSDVIIVIGTSMQVYPAAGLISYAPRYADIYYIDPKPHISYELSLRQNLRVIEKTAAKGVPELVTHLVSKQA
jgi:NAD-dependent deacetylase